MSIWFIIYLIGVAFLTLVIFSFYDQIYNMAQYDMHKDVSSEDFRWAVIILIILWPLWFFIEIIRALIGDTMSKKHK